MITSQNEDGNEWESFGDRAASARPIGETPDRQGVVSRTARDWGMRAGLAAKSADRWMSGVVVAVAAALSGTAFYIVSQSLADPYPTAGHGNWIIQTAAAPVSVETAQVAVATEVALAETPA